MKNHDKEIYTRVLEYINEKQLLAKGEKILLSLSAGKDSMMLLDIFLHLRDQLLLDIAMFHLNHMMRGKDADDDEKFVAEISRSNNIQLFLYKFDFKKNKPKGFSFEQYARKKRYELLNKVFTENNFQKIATAHNRDDNIETILMRILSGTGIHGLGGIECRRGGIIRPLLILSSKEVYEHLVNKKIQWREDLSNKDEKYLRNFLRNSLIPKITSRFDGAGEALLSLSNIAKDYTSLIDELVKEQGELYIFENKSAIFEKDIYIKDKKLFKYVISKAIRENFNEFVTIGMLEEIYKKAVTKKTNLLLYKNRNILVKKTFKNNKKVIVISENTGYNHNKIDWEYKIDLTLVKNVSIFIKEINRYLNFRVVDYNYFQKNRNFDLIFVSLKEDIKEARIRNRRNGDRIVLEQGSKKIKELLIEYKFEKLVKDMVPLFIIDSHVAVFMPGIVSTIKNRVSVDFHVKNDSKKILAIHSEEYQL
ncbi:MAG: tRNA lysidine(34) synthetase TilS [Spirochaetes bacterium]|nr:tRNA lysidine(34) synthetase TilS [Spirochaetota bacterium]